MRIKEDGAGAVREVPGYQYEKFFDAMAVANRDKWQQADAADTSFKPFAWIRKGIFGSSGGETKIRRIITMRRYRIRAVRQKQP